MLSCDDTELVKNVKEGAGFVGENANLLEVQNGMNSSKNCQDVFVNVIGNKDVVIKGWITNDKLTELAKV